jgi:hypothetical protein
MGTLYMMQNYPAGTAGPSPGQTTSATLFTQLQVQPSTSGMPIRVVEWGVSFNASAVGVPFQCDLVDTISIAATVTAFAAADVSVVNPDTPNQSGTTAGIPFILSTTASGYLSSAEGTITSIRSFDCQFVEPIGGYYKQFPLGHEPLITLGHILRVRVHGDGTTKCIAYVIVEV